MPVTIHLSGHLKPFAGGEVEIGLAGDMVTVGEALSELWKRHPALRDRVLNEQGEIRQHVNIFIGGQDVKRGNGLVSLLGSNDVHIFNAVSGG